MKRTLKYWNENRPVEIIKSVKKQYGEAWSLFGTELREAMVAKAVFDVVRAQAKESVDIEAMDELYFACLETAGLRD